MPVNKGHVDKETGADSSRGDVKRRGKRKLTEQRRLQNKAAQKKFRDKQKTRLEELEKLASHQNASYAVPSQLTEGKQAETVKKQPNHEAPDGHEEPIRETTEVGTDALIEPSPDNQPTAYNGLFIPPLSDTWDEIGLNPEIYLPQENLDFNYDTANAFLQYTTLPVANSLDAPGLDMQQQLMPRYDFTNAMVNEPVIDIGQTFLSGIDDLAINQILQNAEELERAALNTRALAVKNQTLNYSFPENHSQVPGTSLVPIPAEGIQMQRTNQPSTSRKSINASRVSIYVALMANAAILGVSPKVAKGDEFMSIFYRPDAGASDITKVKLKYAHVKANLKPGDAQIKFPHEFWIDLFPFPYFRERAIALSSQEPIAFDIKDLKEDICNYGVVCWGGESRSGASTGSPWDMRSWEAQPWFLQKWWMLTGGEDGDMAAQSRWWREMKGED